MSIHPLEFHPYERFHLDLMEPDEMDLKNMWVLAATEGWEGYAVTVMHDLNPIAVVLLAYRDDDAVELAVVGSKALRSMPATCLDLGRGTIARLKQQYRRVVIEVHDDYPVTRRFAERLGFVDYDGAGRMIHD